MLAKLQQASRSPSPARPGSLPCHPARLALPIDRLVISPPREFLGRHRLQPRPRPLGALLVALEQHLEGSRIAAELSELVERDLPRPSLGWWPRPREQLGPAIGDALGPAAAPDPRAAAEPVDGALEARRAEPIARAVAEAGAGE